jgi:hypothetical protein
MTQGSIVDLRATRFEFARDRVIGDSQIRVDDVQAMARITPISRMELPSASEMFSSEPLHPRCLVSEGRHPMLVTSAAPAVIEAGFPLSLKITARRSFEWHRALPEVA